ncbi:hypothetical protein BDA99DRAFT_556702 [Phascolomyces articulosus]|uniref:Uncharacterized protein n=1 Tax=Phascolomyces articulosus TaxID=60185 RepID=A0AAD5KKB6_9FUNG|nr:hypothetical protein BDA99DRAFT_556702 [Phascolomyces articulosus]
MDNHRHLEELNTSLHPIYNWPLTTNTTHIEDDPMDDDTPDFNIHNPAHVDLYSIMDNNFNVSVYEQARLIALYTKINEIIRNRNLLQQRLQILAQKAIQYSNDAMIQPCSSEAERWRRVDLMTFLMQDSFLPQPQVPNCLNCKAALSAQGDEIGIYFHPAVAQPQQHQQ